MFCCVCCGCLLGVGGGGGGGSRAPGRPWSKGAIVVGASLDPQTESLMGKLGAQPNQRESMEEEKKASEVPPN